MRSFCATLYNDVIIEIFIIYLHTVFYYLRKCKYDNKNNLPQYDKLQTGTGYGNVTAERNEVFCCLIYCVINSCNHKTYYLYNNLTMKYTGRNMSYWENTYCYNCYLYINNNIMK